MINANSPPSPPSTQSHDENQISSTNKKGQIIIHPSSSSSPSLFSIPNHQLSTEEKTFKRKLKQELKLNQKIQKLKTRIRHAQSRNDAVVEQSTKRELEELLRIHHHFLKDRPKPPPCVSENKEEEERCKEFILTVYHQFKSQDVSSSSSSSSSSSVSIDDCTRNLLRHMTKGTQSRDMFRDSFALWGYTKLKFLERGMLFVTSFAKLLDRQRRRAAGDDLLTTMTITRAISIGCGPGNDVLGLIALLPDKQLEQVWCLDYAIDDWKRVILDRFKKVIHPKFVKEMMFGFCDVTRSLEDNSKLRECLEQQQHHEGCDVYLFSYILTETRGKWEQFVLELMNVAKRGSVFYFAEPKPWQLHQLIHFVKKEEEKVKDKKEEGVPFFEEKKIGEKKKKEEAEVENLGTEFIWADSSMESPHLQNLDGRVGPAVLFAIKR